MEFFSLAFSLCLRPSLPGNDWKIASEILYKMKQQLGRVGISRNKRHQQRQLFNWHSRKAHSPWHTMVTISSFHSEARVTSGERVQCLGSFFYSLKLLGEIFWLHQIQWPNNSQLAWRNVFHLFIQCCLLVLTFSIKEINSWRKKYICSLLAENWPKYAFEYRTMNPHVKALQKLHPVISSQDIGNQTEHAASSFHGKKCHLQIIPITIENHQSMPRHLCYCQWLAKVVRSSARHPLLRSAAVKMTHASSRKIKCSALRQVL